MTPVCLSSLSPGDSCVIETIEIDGPVRRRLFDLGIWPGSKAQCAYIATSGTPIAFWIKDSLIALRLCDCRRVGVIRSA